MRVTTTSTVVDGKIETPSTNLGDEVQVAILAPDAGQPIELSPAEQQELLLVMDEIRRGEFADGTDLLEKLRSRPLT